MYRTLLLAGLATAVCATSALAASDDFNRTRLGRHWVIPDGSMSIVADQLRGSSLGLGYDINASTDTSVSAEVFLTGTDLEYGAVASGNIGGGNNAFVKIQAQTADGKFSNGAFYNGDNSGSDFFALNSEVPSPAKLSVSFCGTVATMKIVSSAGKQVYKFDYGTTYGTGGGLGTYGSVALDNFRASTTGCALEEKGTWIRKGAPGPRDMSHSK